MSPGPGERLTALCDATAARLTDPALRRRVGQIRDRLGAPLKIAVAGAVSSGKSTLVNALLGLPVAPVDAGECTRLVTQYEYGDDDGRVEAECEDGRVVVTRLLPGHRMPPDLGVPPERVRRLRVRLALDTLRAITVIDTPGMNTVTAENEQAARRMLFGTDGDDDRAQALIYVLRYVQRFDDATLAEFRSLTDACGMSCVNTLAVLTQIDRRGDEEDPWPTARRLAARAYEDLRTSVFDVVPVIGLLAETARTPALGPEELEALTALAGLDDDDLDFLLLDLDDIPGPPESPIPAEMTRRLVARLHRYGLRVAVAAVREGEEALRRTLLEMSGFGSAASAGTVAAGLAHFARRAEQLKALTAITQLRRLALEDATGADRAALDVLAAELDETRPIAAGLSGLRIFAAVEAVGRGQLVLPGDMQAELFRMARTDDPAGQLGLPPGTPARDVAEAARAATERWRAQAMIDRGRVGGQRARDVLRVLEDLAVPAPPATAGPGADVHGISPVDVPVDVPGDAVGRLLASPLVPAADKEALRRLLSGGGPTALVGAGPAAAPADVAALAAALSGRFRSLGQLLTSVLDRRAAQSVCDAFALIAVHARHIAQGDSPHAGHH
ncbi:dynamin family protein [Microbispora sp. CA-135349]|uniref:dynamin family protein n=1 Tax=Microbispora sp. CA-135349 TaxID=3239953 RepID=UPI003D8A9E75